VLAFGCLAGGSRFALRFARKAAVRAANTAVRKMHKAERTRHQKNTAAMPVSSSKFHFNA
jgi:hypothetical protein